MEVIVLKDRSPQSKIQSHSPKLYSLNINDDILCIERLEQIVKHIKDNHNKIIIQKFMEQYAGEKDNKNMSKDNSESLHLSELN